MADIHLVMGTPNSYLQSPGILHISGEWIKKFGQYAFLVTGEKSWQAAGDSLAASLSQVGVRYEVNRYRGECSYEEVERLSGVIPHQADLIVGVGGGKVMDTAKALGDKLSIPFVSVPTLASTCAAVTPLSVMYTAEGVYKDFPLFKRNAILTLVDTEVLAKAPVEFLTAGIGDTLAKWYEALASSANIEPNLPTTAGLQMAKLCYDTLIDYSAAAIADAKRGIASQSLQRVIDAIILMSGMVGGLGAANCRSAAAHAIHNGLSVIPEVHHALHGAKVAYGIIVQLLLEKRSAEEIVELIQFYQAVGLPSTLEELGVPIPLPPEQLSEVVRISLLPESTMGMMPFPVTEEMVKEAMEQAENWPKS